MICTVLKFRISTNRQQSLPTIFKWPLNRPVFFFQYCRKFLWFCKECISRHSMRTEKKWVFSIEDYIKVWIPMYQFQWKNSNRWDAVRPIKITNKSLSSPIITAACPSFDSLNSWFPIIITSALFVACFVLIPTELI